MNELKKYKIEIILVAITIVSIFIAIFALNRGPKVVISEKLHTEDIRNIEDSIRVIGRKIDSLNWIINTTTVRSVKIEKQLEKLQKYEKETNSNIANGSWDYNIKFLTKYLSEKDSIGF